MIKNSFESYPDNENKLFSWEGTHEMKLEKFSRKAPHSWPEIRKQTFFLSRYSGNSAGKIFQKCSSLMTRNQKFWKKSGKIFQETLWVTTRFLEIFSRIWQYGLNFRPVTHFLLNFLIYYSHFTRLDLHLEKCSDLGIWNCWSILFA